MQSVTACHITHCICRGCQSCQVFNLKLHARIDGEVMCRVWSPHTPYNPRMPAKRMRIGPQRPGGGLARTECHNVLCPPPSTAADHLAEGAQPQVSTATATHNSQYITKVGDGGGPQLESLPQPQQLHTQPALPWRKHGQHWSHRSCPSPSTPRHPDCAASRATWRAPR